jgi:hypothetical protein
MSEVYAIMNLEKYAGMIRARAAATIAESSTEELEEFVTIQQTTSMILEHSIGKDEEGRPLLDDGSHAELFRSVKERIFNSGLSKLAAKDIVECAWDDEKNEMIFWTK